MSVIEIKNLSKRFVVEGHTVDALRDVNMSIEAGDIYGIIGMSGAGKSTLVRSINYLEKPTEGEVRIDGINLAGLSRTELRKMRGTIGMISPASREKMNQRPMEPITKDCTRPMAATDICLP